MMSAASEESSKSENKADKFRHIYYRTCKEDTPNPITGIRSGVLPSWLKGSLLRNGPGVMQVGEYKYNHAFDGLAVIHGFCIKNGEVTYQNRFLKSEAYKKCMQANRIVVSEFGTLAYPDPCRTLLQRFMAFFSRESSEVTDNALVNIMPFGDELYAMTETPFIHKIDPETLESQSRVDVSKYVTMHSTTAHPHVEKDSTVYNLGTIFGPQPVYIIAKFPSEANDRSMFEQASVVAKVPAQSKLHPGYYHSFGITDNYFILVEQSVTIAVGKIMMQSVVKKSFRECLNFDKNRRAIFHVIKKATGEVVDVKYTAEPFFTFHHINAYEDSDHLVVDLCGFDDGSVIDSLVTEDDAGLHGRPVITSKPRRYVLPLNTQLENASSDENLCKLNYSKASAVRAADGTISLAYEILTDELKGCELPRINYDKCNGKEYRYAYFLEFEDKLNYSVTKLDIKTREVKKFLKEGYSASEPVFVPRPEAEDEDDGVVLSMLLNINDETEVSLVVLDGKTLKELASVTFSAPSSVTGTFHGWFHNAK